MAKTPRNVVTPVRFTEKDHEAIVKAADRENMSVSEYVRAAALSYMAITGNSYALSQLGRGMMAWVRELRERAPDVIAKVFG